MNEPPTSTTLTPAQIAEKIAAARQILGSIKGNIENLSPEERRPLMELLDSETRPAGWRSSSTVTYYKKEYAEWLRVYLDKIRASTDHSKDWQIEARLYRISPKTLYLRITQAWLYIIDYLDSDGVYKALREKIYVRKKREFVMFEWKDAFRFMSEEIGMQEIDSKKVKTGEWKVEFETWLAEGETNLLEIKGLALDAKDIAYVREMIGLLPSTNPVRELELTASKIKLLKIPEGMRE